MSSWAKQMKKIEFLSIGASPLKTFGLKIYVYISNTQNTHSIYLRVQLIYNDFDTRLKEYPFPMVAGTIFPVIYCTLEMPLQLLGLT